LLAALIFALTAGSANAALLAALIFALTAGSERIAPRAVLPWQARQWPAPFAAQLQGLRQ
jgi:hypothetical protein